MLTDTAFEKKHDELMTAVHVNPTGTRDRIIAEKQLRDLEFRALIAAPLEAATEDMAHMAEFLASGN